MNPGKLNRRIRFYRNERTGEQTELGADEMAERMFYECWPGSNRVPVPF